MKIHTNKCNIVILFVFLILLSCHTDNDAVIKETDSNKATLEEPSVEKSNVFDCHFSLADTCNLNTCVKYVSSIDSTTLDLEISMNGISKKLGYAFDCSAPGVLIPRYLASNSNYICMERGCGSGCWVYVLYKLSKKTIVEVDTIEEIQIPLRIDLDAEKIFFKDSNGKEIFYDFSKN